MRTETVIMALKDRRRVLEETVFTKSKDDFVKQQGIWQGLGDAIEVITDQAKKEAMNDG